MRQCTSVTDRQTNRRTDGLASWHKREMYIIHLALKRFIHGQFPERHKSSSRRDNSHTATSDANFRGFPRRVRQTRAVDVVTKRSQAVVSGSDDKCVTRLVGEMTSISASWPFGEMARRRVDLLAESLPYWRITKYVVRPDEGVSRDKLPFLDHFRFLPTKIPSAKYSSFRYSPHNSFKNLI